MLNQPLYLLSNAQATVKGVESAPPTVKQCSGFFSFNDIYWFATTKDRTTYILGTSFGMLILVHNDDDDRVQNDFHV